MAVRTPKPDGLDLTQMRPVRSSSFSSDVMSNSAKSAGTAHTVPYANPPPAYIAQTEASDLITAELDRRVLVSQPALALLNEFLDHVLYSLISISHSVSLGQLKAAVPAVLKPRLGKAALRVAEEELKEYMEDEEAEELYSNRHSIQPRLDFDADLVWKLARLRCMVYARMGDLEEEDEEEWLEKERLLEQAAAFPVDARQEMAVMPGSAIFLTSVIEYLGEQALYYAAQYAQKRHDNAHAHDATTPTPESQIAARHADIVLEGKDMNHVGRDSPLSRLWRSWRRNTRSPMDAASGSISPEALLSPGIDSMHSRTTSSSAHHSIHPIPEEHRRGAAETSVFGTPSQIPLPIGEHDIEEIEGRENDTDGEGIENVARRPISMPTIPGRFPETPMGEGPDFPQRSPLRPSFYRKRSSSMPITATPFDATAPADRNSFVLPIQNDAVEDQPNAVVAGPVPVEGPATGDSKQPAWPASEAEAKQSRFQVSSRPQTAQSSEQLNTTVGVLAGALGAVGVHQVGKELKSPEADSAQVLAGTQPSPFNQPLTSASITRSGDFDMMYVPEGRLSPEEQEQKRVADVASRGLAARRGRSHETFMTRQYEDHMRYSQQAHEMDTPSIYTHRDHSPRFPKDMRASASQERPDKASLNHAATPEREVPYYNRSTCPKVMPLVAEAQASRQLRTDSPVSPVSSKHSNKHLPLASEHVPEMPPTQAKRQSSADNMPDASSPHHSQSSSRSSQLLGFTRDATGKPQTIYQQRAAGDMTDEARRAHASTPNSGNVSRPGTAHSASSSRKQHLRLRADSENNISKSGSNDGITKRSLEVLINSDETLHYTLTPATATFKEEDVNPSPNRMQTQALADFFCTTAPPSQENATPRTNRSQKLSMEANRAPQAVPGQEAQKAAPASGNVTLQKPPAPKHKKLLVEPRDATVPRSTGIRDLADYVRSTGPSNDDQLPKAITGGVAAIHTPKQTPLKQPVSPTSSAQGRPQNRLKFQARDARPARGAESSALIDFIREGPPRDEGDHRINRHIAPFRTTMDSDDLNALASSLPKDSSDTNGNTTLNSNTPLINNAAKAGTSSQSRAQPAAQAQPIMHNKVTTDEEDGMPKRTRRRVKDPYAIDDSDDDLLEAPPPKQAQDESLIDFLRNTAPPPTMTAQPILSSPKQAKPLNRTPSVDKLKEFVRNRSTTSGSDRQEQLRTQSRARAESPHLTQTGSKLDSYRPTQPTHAKHVDRDRANKVVNRAESRSESRAEPRAPVKLTGATADLADYLRNTGPPPSSEEKPQPFVLSNNKQTNGVQKQEGGLRKFFSRKGRNQ
ncbi:hypothetical protein OHC33_000979 [Knufia fluminis]|uniref:Uncharacterized protein n=1 Tax=Knufia fluminis TaxID=191047 RepID=A0AAN8ENS5_9EURO|nr:hypothetical protein OHC33_000979 [Knufia fluminis]